MYNYINVNFDDSTGALYCSFKNIIYFSEELLKELIDLMNPIKKTNGFYQNKQVNFFILYSDIPTVWNLGGDLESFVSYIKTKNIDKLKQYADLCFECFIHVDFFKSIGIGTFSLINGDAYGGGLETALMFDYVYAENQSRLSFPEVKFNLFPGMGGYTFLKRKINPNLATNILLSGKRYEALDFYKYGLILDVFENSQGLHKIKSIINNYFSNLNAFKTITKINHQYSLNNEVQEYREIVDIWVYLCLENTPDKLLLMEKLYISQKNKGTKLIQ